MKKKILAFTLLFAFVFGCVCACDAVPGGMEFSYRKSSLVKKDGADPEGYYEDDDAAYSKTESGESATGERADSYDDTVEEKPTAEGDPVKEKEKEESAGTLSAAAWNDNTYYDLWRELFAKGVEGQSEGGKFANYTGTNDWNLPSLNRIKVHVTLADEVPARGAKVCLLRGGSAVCAAVTDAKGNAYLFADGADGVRVFGAEGYRDVALEGGQTEVNVEVEGVSDVKDTIEIMFVIDVTGSMGDEINYLKAELGDVIARVTEAYNDANVSLAFLFYRDLDDEEDFAYVDFRDVTNPEDYKIQRAKLMSENADGGGDYEEAVDRAMEMAVSKQWNSGNTTKLIFHVLDAPPHSSSEIRTRFSNAVKTAAEKGIRICPILSSGADGLTEYLTRSEAIYTGGTFVFLTNDSGVGGDHLDPDLPNIVVERLNDLLVRLIKGYYTGTFDAPVPYAK